MSILSFDQINRALVDKNNKVILFWIHKAGCTTAAKMFFKSMGILDESNSYNSFPHLYRQDIFYKKYGYGNKEILEDKTYRKMKVVRNPYSKVVSSYITYCKCHKLWGSDDPINISFREFIKLLTFDPKKIKMVMLAHCETQYDENVDPYINNIIKLETFEKDLSIFNEQHKTNYSISGLSESSHHTVRDKNITIFVGDHNYFEIIKIGIPEYKNFYDDQIRKMVEFLYHVDIEKYDYHFD